MLATLLLVGSGAALWLGLPVVFILVGAGLVSGIAHYVEEKPA